MVTLPLKVPSALKAANHWVLQKDKKPVGRDGYPAKGWQLPSFWISYQEAITALSNNGAGFSGLGFIIAREPDRGDRQIIGIDLDCCRDPVSGRVSPWAVTKLDQLNSYTEVSPSGTGFHIWVYGKLPDNIVSASSKGQDPAELPPEIWARIKAVKPTASRYNSLEIYEDGPRHFTVTGQAYEGYPSELMQRQNELEELLGECPNRSIQKAEDFSDPDSEWFREMSEAVKGQGLPHLGILRVVDTSNWEQSGGQLFGPHPTEGSTTGRNVVINPGMNVYAYMHNGLKKGGDAWTWLACECGAIKWEEAGSGSLRDAAVIERVKEYAVQKGYFKREELFSVNFKNLVPTADGFEIDSDPLTEGGNANRFVRLYGKDLKYCHTFKKWFVWDGQRWKMDVDGHALRLAEGVVSLLYAMAASAPTKEARNALASFAKSSDTNFHRKAILEIAKNRFSIAITSEKLDCDQWLLGTPAGTIDLKNLVIREPNREDLITRSIGTKHDPKAKCDLWVAFLKKIFRDDEELIRYVQRAVGYSLTGAMVEQVFFFCHGKGANGKSVFLAILRALLGDYAQQADFSTFLVQRSEKVRNDLAALAGARLIVASEAEEGSKLSMQTIKAWTGGDPITARFLHAEFFTFRPVGKIWLAANTKPTISERNYAAWRRVHLIPFLVTIPKAEQDKELEKKLRGELPGILQWALEGLREYHRIGLEPPEAVKVATEAYRRENDSLESFIAEACRVQKLGLCKNKDLFRAYETFCREMGLNALSQTKFSIELKAKPGILSKPSEHGMVWRGIELKPDWIPEGFKKDEEPANPSVQQRETTNLKGLKGNAEILPYPASYRNNTDKPSDPSGNEATDTELKGLHPPSHGREESKPNEQMSTTESKKEHRASNPSPGRIEEENTESTSEKLNEEIKPVEGFTPEENALLARIYARTLKLGGKTSPFVLAVQTRANGIDVGVERCRAWLLAHGWKPEVQ